MSTRDHELYHAGRPLRCGLLGLQALEEIVNNDATYHCNGHPTGLTCASLAQYALDQKRKKLGRLKVSVVPVVGSAETLRSIATALTKTDRGRQRELNAHVFHARAREGCPKSRAVVRELMGGADKATAEEMVRALCEWDEGWKLINEKLAST